MTDKLPPELEEITRSITDGQVSVLSAFIKLLDERDALREERDALREALEELIRVQTDGDWEYWQGARERAEAALARKPKE